MKTVEVLVGRVGRPHGVGGDLVVDVRTDEPERRFAPTTTFETPRGPLTVVDSRWHGRRLLVTFAEVGDRSTAQTLRGVDLRLDVPADERPADPEEFYDHQLVGLRAETREGVVLGEVTDVLHLPAQDMLVLRHVGREVLVPFVMDIVPAVDVDAGRVVIEDKPGLLADEPADEPTAQPDDAETGA